MGKAEPVAADEALARALDGKCPVDGRPSVDGALVCKECQEHYRMSKPWKAGRRQHSRWR